MSKTNHQRNFVDTKDYSVPPGDHVNGKHGAAKKRKGYKKFLNSRNRFHQNSIIQKLSDEDESLPDFGFKKFEISTHKQPYWTPKNRRNCCDSCGKKSKKYFVTTGTNSVCQTCYEKI